jgi:arabinogalactan endo-1,4-beta-galactosidase
MRCQGKVEKRGQRMINRKSILVVGISALVMLLVAVVVIVVLKRPAAAPGNTPEGPGNPVIRTDVPATQIVPVEGSQIQVNPIDGLTPDFIMGADVSMLAQIEASGGKYYVACGS